MDEATTLENGLNQFAADPTARNWNAVQDAVQAYSAARGSLPDDMQRAVDAAGDVAAGLAGAQTVTTAPVTDHGVTPPLISPAGITLGAMTVPWMGVAIVGGLLYVAMKGQKGRRG